MSLFKKYEVSRDGKILLLLSLLLTLFPRISFAASIHLYIYSGSEDVFLDESEIYKSFLKATSHSHKLSGSKDEVKIVRVRAKSPNELTRQLQALPKEDRIEKIFWLGHGNSAPDTAVSGSNHRLALSQNRIPYQCIIDAGYDATAPKEERDAVVRFSEEKLPNPTSMTFKQRLSNYFWGAPRTGFEDRAESIVGRLNFAPHPQIFFMSCLLASGSEEDARKKMGVLANGLALPPGSTIYAANTELIAKVPYDRHAGKGKLFSAVLQSYTGLSDDSLLAQGVSALVTIATNLKSRTVAAYKTRQTRMYQGKLNSDGSLDLAPAGNSNQARRSFHYGTPSAVDIALKGLRARTIQTLGQHDSQLNSALKPCTPQNSGFPNVDENTAFLLNHTTN